MYTEGASRLKKPIGVRVVSGEPVDDSMEKLQGIADELQYELMRTYNDRLNSSIFCGGWCEEPKYTENDYESYREWIRYNSNLSDERHLIANLLSI